MSHSQNHDAYKKIVSLNEIRSICNSESPTKALEIILSHGSPAMICAAIDSLPPLVATFILTLLSVAKMKGNKIAEETITLATKEQINGLKGVREMFAGIRIPTYIN